MGSQADQTQSPLGNALSTVRGLRRMVTIMGLQSLFLWMRLLPRNGVDLRD